MTAVIRRHRDRPAPAIQRRIVDTPDRVAARVALVRRSGRLQAMTTPRQLPDGRALVVVTLTAEPLRPPVPVRRRVAVAAAVAVPVLALGAYLAYAIAQLVGWAVDHWAAIVASLVAAGFLLAALRPNHRALCPGVVVHCRGCGGGH
jgi:hypothetical protein